MSISTKKYHKDISINKNYIFSVLIPFYNCLQFLPQALESIKNSKYPLSQIEVIIVNDGWGGAMDIGCLEIIKLFPQLNIFYYYKENGNWGSVINYAKNNKIIHGKYFTVLDADDKLTNKAFKLVEKKFANNDAVIGCFYAWNDTKNLKIKYFPYFYWFSQTITKTDRKFTPCSFPVAKFYKTELIYKIADLQENIPFQDSIFYNRMMKFTKSIYFYNKCLGYWRYSRLGNSTSAPFTKEKVDQIIKTARILEKEVPNAAAISMMIYGKFPKFYRKYYSEKLKFKKNLNFSWLCQPFNFFSKIAFYCFSRKRIELVD